MEEIRQKQVNERASCLLLLILLLIIMIRSCLTRFDISSLNYLLLLLLRERLVVLRLLLGLWRN